MKNRLLLTIVAGIPMVVATQLNAQTTAADTDNYPAVIMPYQIPSIAEANANGEELDEAPLLDIDSTDMYFIVTDRMKRISELYNPVHKGAIEQGAINIFYSVQPKRKVQ